MRQAKHLVEMTRNYKRTNSELEEEEPSEGSMTLDESKGKRVIESTHRVYRDNLIDLG